MANHPKLTPTQIEELKRLYEQEGVSQAALAKQFGVSITTVRVKLGIHPQSKNDAQVKEATRSEIVNPLHAATEEAIKSLPILLREGGPSDLSDKKKEEKPKRRIVGVNI